MFVLSMPLLSVLCDPTASTGDATVAAEMLAIALRAPWRSAFFLDAMGSPGEGRSGVTGVLALPASIKIYSIK